jgi:hypothetical protein
MGEDGNPTEEDAATAFELLRREVSLLRRGVEALTAERQSQPDYTATLMDLDRRLEDVRGWARKISQRPALQLTPTAIADQIESAVSQARDMQSKHAVTAGAALRSAADQLDSFLARARTAGEQRRWILFAASSSFLAGYATGVWLW